MTQSDKQQETAQPDETGPEFPLWSIEDLSRLPKPEWLIDGILPKAAVGVMHGMPTTGKSFLALKFGLHVATGAACFGAPVASGGVIYVAAEGLTGYEARIRAWMTAEGFSTIDNFYVVATPVQLHVEGEVESLARSIRALATPPALIIIDTLARCFVGEDENNATAMTGLVASAERFTRELGCSVLLVHHSRKDGTIERGSIALRGGVEFMLSVTRGANGVMTLTCTKLKNGPEFAAMHARLAPVADSCVVERCDAPARVAPPLSERQRNCLTALGTRKLTYSEWKHAAGESGVTKPVFDKARAFLVRRGLVEQDDTTQRYSTRAN